MDSRHSSNLRSAPAICVVMVTLLVAGQLWAKGRDSDASRMQAREIAVGASDNDSLAPPSDATDWRYFKLDSKRKVTVSVNPTSDKATVSVAMTTATGESLASSQSTGRPVTVSEELDPGIYYFSVESNRATDYTVRVD